MEETVEHTSKAFLGLTMNCARCHDHKYDPWTQNDYFQFRAIFEPYQVRTDQVPGELDYEKDGIPRVYDAHLDVPTYFLTQGDEARPVKEKVMPPAVPTLLARYAPPLSIQAKPLPTEAYSTGLRPWVLDNHRQGARAKRESAQAAYDSARQRVDRWIKATDPANEQLIVEESFDSLQEDRWQTVSGHWEIVDRQIRQTATPSAISSLVSRVPLNGDFELNLRLTIHGGEKWKSAGFAFYVTEQQRIGIYLSALADGSKLQVYHRADGGDHYPAEWAMSRAVPLDQPMRLTIRARGGLVQVLIDGAHALSCRVPIKPKSSVWELFTYDAQASFDDIRLKSLSAEIDLPEPGSAPVVVSLEEAFALREIAGAEFTVAMSEQTAIEAKAIAMRSGADDELNQKAVKAENEHRVALAEHQWLLARHQSRSLPEKERRAKLDPLLREIDQARAKLHEPGTSFTPIRGSSKAPESNQEDAASLAKPFPSQTSGRRSALAWWMTDQAHPTFARVGVNHLWARHMGQPLVKTVIDFGLKGAKPTHPELLDTLAHEWVDRQFDMKVFIETSSPRTPIALPRVWPVPEVMRRRSIPPIRSIGGCPTGEWRLRCCGIRSSFWVVSLIGECMAQREPGRVPVEPATKHLLHPFAQRSASFSRSVRQRQHARVLRSRQQHHSAAVAGAGQQSVGDRSGSSHRARDRRDVPGRIHCDRLAHDLGDASLGGGRASLSRGNGLLDGIGFARVGAMAISAVADQPKRFHHHSVSQEQRCEGRRVGLDRRDAGFSTAALAGSRCCLCLIETAGRPNTRRRTVSRTFLPKRRA